MATGKRPPAGSQGARRRRSAPTIDLRATEVAREAAATPPRAEEPPARSPEPPPETAFRPQPSPQPEPWRDTYRPQPDPPRQDPPREPRAAEAERPSIAWLPPELPWPLVGAGVAGAACVLLVVIVLWLVWPSGHDPSATLAPRLAAIEAQLREIATRPVSPSVDPRAIEDLALRLARLESAVAAPRAPVTDPAITARLAASENAARSLADQVAALTQRADALTIALREAAQRADTAATAARDAGQRADEASAAAREARSRAEAATAALVDAQNTARVTTAGTDRVLGLAVAGAALRSAVERGDPFVTELAAAKQLAADPVRLAALEPFAAAGLPSNAALASELAALIPQMLRAAGSARRDGGFLDRLQANAERLVRIRPVDDPPGDDPTAVLARVEARAAHSDIPGALTELQRLPAAVRAPAQAWIAKAEARAKAADASRRFAADAVAGLKATQ